LKPDIIEPGMQEIELIIKYFNNFKTPGEDEIKPELLKLVRKKSSDRIVSIKKKDLWEKGYMSKDWNLGIYAQSNLTYHRRIPLLDTEYNVSSIAIIRRLEMYAVDIVVKYQC